MATGQLFYDPVARPLSATGASLPNGFYNFYVSGTTNAAQVYQDPGLTTPFPAVLFNGVLSTIVTADGTGAMPPMYLNPVVIYRVQLYNSSAQLIEDVDPYIPAMPVTGNGQLVLNAQGELTIAAPVPGGTGISLIINARAGGTALELVGAGAGSAAIIANTTVVAGSQTATFTATNKPGLAAQAVFTWLPITCDGATYYIPLWK